MKDEILNILNMQDILDKYGIKQKGYMFHCPLHGIDKNPSAKCYKKSYYCFELTPTRSFSALKSILQFLTQRIAVRPTRVASEFCNTLARICLLKKDSLFNPSPNVLHNRVLRNRSKVCFSTNWHFPRDRIRPFQLDRLSFVHLLNCIGQAMAYLHTTRQI